MAKASDIFSCMQVFGCPAANENANIKGCFFDRFLVKHTVITENPMTGRERRAVGSLALLYCFRMLGLFMVLPLLAIYASDFADATPTMIGLALGIYGLTQAALQIPFGWLSDRVGRKPVIIFGLLLFALGSVIAAVAESMNGIILGRILQGSGAIASTVMALVADLTREEQRTKAMALVGISIGLSFAGAMVLGPVVAALGGLASVFWFSALLAVVGMGIVILLVPTPYGVSVAHQEEGARLGFIGRGLVDGGLVRLNFGVFVLHFILVACFLVMPGVLEQTFGVSREQHWLVYLPVLLLSFVGMVPLMILAERGKRPRQMFLLGIVLIFAAIGVLDLTSTNLLFYGGLWLFFVGFNYLEATLPSLVSKTVFAGGKGTAMGVYSSCQFMGAFTGGAGGGWLLEHWGSGVLTGVSLALCAVWWLLVHTAPMPAAVTNIASPPVTNT
ncbi:MAG: MFS transporter [Halioglobus sp.]|nr:MFS transporter [Halioglobus sp.]